MKKIILDVKSFLLFRAVAEKYKIFFTYGYAKGGIVTVRANAYDLNQIGY